MKTAIVTYVLIVLTASCYRTKIVSPMRGVAAGPTHEQRQWFTLGGAVGLSDAAGEECPGGVSYAESRLSGTDILIQVGLTAVGVIAGVAACGLPDPTSDDARAFSTCISLAGVIGPFLLGTRTVNYRCTARAPAAPPGAVRSALNGQGGADALR